MHIYKQYEVPPPDPLFQWTIPTPPLGDFLHTDRKETLLSPGSLFTTGRKEKHGKPHLIFKSEETILILFFTNAGAVPVQLNVFSLPT